MNTKERKDRRKFLYQLIILLCCYCTINIDHIFSNPLIDEHNINKKVVIYIDYIGPQDKPIPTIVISTTSLSKADLKELALTADDLFNHSHIISKEDFDRLAARLIQALQQIPDGQKNSNRVTGEYGLFRITIITAQEKVIRTLFRKDSVEFISLVQSAISDKYPLLSKDVSYIRLVADSR